MDAKTHHGEDMRDRKPTSNRHIVPYGVTKSSKITIAVAVMLTVIVSIVCAGGGVSLVTAAYKPKP